MEWTLVQLDIAVVSGSPETERAIEHYWREADLVERHSEFIRHARRWCERPAIRSLFERLRGEPPIREGELFPRMMDWLALSDLLGRTDEVLAWFDAQAALGGRIPEMNRLRRMVYRRGRLADWLIFAEPLHRIEEDLESYASTREILGDHPEILASELEQVDREIAHWRRVAKALRPTELDEIDACIAASERSTQIRAWIDGPDAELTEALISDVLF